MREATVPCSSAISDDRVAYTDAAAAPESSGDSGDDPASAVATPRRLSSTTASLPSYKRGVHTTTRQRKQTVTLAIGGAPYTAL